MITGSRLRSGIAGTRTTASFAGTPQFPYMGHFMKWN
jgi:hypothetical protein